MLITIAVEGASDEPVARRIVREAGLQPDFIYPKGGKAALDTKLADYNRAAARHPWFVLRDLDHDEICAGTLVARLLPHSSPGMCFRLAVRATEAWLLADRGGLASYLGVPLSRLPEEPDSLDDPKKHLIDLARRSRSRAIREDLVPRTGSTARVGPAFMARISEFSTRIWQPAVAAKASPSLSRCLTALRRVKHRADELPRADPER